MYKILHIPTGSYYTFMGYIDIPTFSDRYDYSKEFKNNKDSIFKISSILNYCKNNPAYFLINDTLETMLILENELAIIEIKI
jgi:hypothetical protein